jgi:hypothetical protein
VVEAPHDLEVLAPGELQLDRGRLPREPDVAAHRRGVANHVVSLDDDPPGIRSQERGEHAHRSRLARAVGSQHAQHGAARHGQVDAAKRAHLAK